MNELQQVLLVFAVVVIAGLYFLSRSRSTGSKKKATSTAQQEPAPQQPEQASKALNELGTAHIPVSKLTHDRLTRAEALEEVEFNHHQATLSFGEDFDLPEQSPPTTTADMPELSPEPAKSVEQEIADEAAVASEKQHKTEDKINSDIALLGTNEKGGKHHRLIVEDPGMNSADYHYAAPEYEKPTFGVPTEELGKSPGVASGEKQGYEVFVILVMSPAQEFSMTALNHALLGVGLIFSDQGIYVKQDSMGNEIIKVANLLEPGVFPSEDHENYATPGVAMILELPSTVRAPRAMDDLIMMARKVSQRLEGKLYNMERQIMKESNLQSMRDTAVAYESEPL
jgi:cell division protein ZipA